MVVAIHHGDCVEVMGALLQQVLPVGGHALDPFAGSGTTLCAAPEGVEVVGIEREAEYVATARARIAHWRPAEKPPLKPSNDTPKESTYVPHDLRSS